MATYTCKYCGFQTQNAGSVIMSCYGSRKSHEWMNATEKPSQYICKYCGHTFSQAGSAINGCVKSPHKTHEWLG